MLSIFAGAIALPTATRSEHLLPENPLPQQRRTTATSCPTTLPASPCRGEVPILNANHSSESRVVPTFFLHDAGSFNLDDRVQCFLQAVGNIPFSSNDLDFHVPPQVAEHANDYWLIDRLRNHSSRVYDESSASFHIVASPIVTSFAATFLPGSPCGGLELHYARMQAIATSLTSLPSFQASAGSDFVLNVDTPHLAEVAAATPVVRLQLGACSAACISRRRSGQTWQLR